MSPSTQNELTVRVVRYDISQWTVGQSLLPFATLASIAARRTQSSIATVIAAGLIVAAFVVFMRARRNFGQQTTRRENGKLHFVQSGEELSRNMARSWTVRGTVARIHGIRSSYKLRFADTDRDALTALLTEHFGAPAKSERRGSPKARAIAAAVMASGLVALGFAIAFENIPLLFVGVVSSIGGGASLGAFSQRIAR
jgi:hypothetical protein